MAGAPPNIALAGIILSIPIAIVAFAGLLVAGVALGWTLLIALGLQTAAFCFILILGLLWRSRANAEEFSSRSIDAQASIPSDAWWLHPGRWELGNECRCLVIAPDGLESRSMTIDLTEMGYEVHHCADPGAMIASIAARPDDWDLVIYDADAAPDPGSAVNGLLELREACPSMPVVLVSSIVRLGALSRERSVAWDVVLPKPFVRDQLLWVVETAVNEHATAAP